MRTDTGCFRLDGRRANGQLNAGLEIFAHELKNDELAALRVQVTVISVGGYDDVQILQPWTDAVDFQPPVIQASGMTPLGKGMDMALEEVRNQKAVYDTDGISRTRPWVIMISDGCPNDYGWEEAAARCRQEEADKRVVVFPIGTEGADSRHSGSFPPSRRNS